MRLGLTALLAALSLLTPAVAGARSASTDIDVTYTSSKAYTVTVNGSAVTTGTVIPPGSYTFIVQLDPNTGPQNPQFTVSGPGVSVNSDLNSTGMGLDGASSFGPYTLQTSSSYTIEDKSIGASTIVTFQTSSTSSTSSTVSTGGATTTTPVSMNGGLTLRGTLAAAISVLGRPSLTFEGAKVTTLKAGFYALRVDDRSKKFGLLLGHGHARLVTLSGKVAVGTNARRIALAPGTWFVECSDGHPRLSFTVTAG